MRPSCIYIERHKFSFKKDTAYSTRKHPQNNIVILSDNSYIVHRINDSANWRQNQPKAFNCNGYIILLNNLRLTSKLKYIDKKEGHASQLPHLSNKLFKYLKWKRCLKILYGRCEEFLKFFLFLRIPQTMEESEL